MVTISMRNETDELPPDFDQFVLRVSDRLFRTALLLCGDRGHAEDLLQSALWRTYQHWGEIHDHPDSYSYRVLVNLSRDRRRLLRRRPQEVAWGCEGSQPEQSRQTVVTRAELVTAIAALPRRLREVIVLRYFLDLSVFDTAASLRISEGAVKAYTARGLGRLRASLGETDDGKVETSG